MNAAIHVALMAAHKADKGIVERLTDAKAVDPSSAIMHRPSDATEQAQLDEAIGLGLVLRRADGRIFLNQRAVRERNEGISYGLLLALMALASVAASVAALIKFATG